MNTNPDYRDDRSGWRAAPLGRLACGDGGHLTHHGRAHDGGLGWCGHAGSRWIRLLLIALALSACGADTDRGGAPYVTIDSSGITIVESSSPVWAVEPRRIEREPILRIGGQDEPHQFGLVLDGLLLSDERIAVPDLMSSDIRIFDFRGNHLATVGGSGEGPGEFQNLSGLLRYPGDSVAVYDQLLQRTTVFPRTFESHRVVRNQVGGNYLAFGVLESGHILLFDPGAGFRPDLPPGLQWDITDVILMDGDDGSYRVVAQLSSRQQVIEPDGNTRRLIPAHGSIQAVARNGFYWATTDRYEIRFYNAQGDLRRIIRRPTEPRAVEPSMVDRYIEAVLDDVRRREGENAVPRYRRDLEEAIYGDDVPLFGLAFVDAEDRLWVSGSVWPDLLAEPRQWTVFSRDGF